MNSVRTFVWVGLMALLLVVSFIPQAAASEWKILDDHQWCDDGDWEEGICEIRETTLSGRDEIAVDGSPNGGIKVEGWDRDEIRLLVKVRVWAKSQRAAREIADEITIVTGDVIRAKGPKQRGKRRGWSVSYRLMVPNKTDLELETVNGGISVRDVAGAIRFSAVNGGIDLSSVGGDVRGHTTNGGITVRLHGDRWKGEGLDVNTTNGGVTVAVPEDYSADLVTGTVNGSIRLDFPVMVQGKIGKQLRTTLGDGGPRVRIKTTNGGVRLKRI